MRERITNRISDELKVILVKFFDENEVNMFIHNIMDDLLIITSINLFDRGIGNSPSASGNYFTSKIRSIADRVITFAKNNLDEKKYFDFLGEFGDMMIVEGELFLASEIYHNVLKYSAVNPSPKVIANANINLGRISIRQANWESANVHLEEAKKIYEEQNDKHGLSRYYHLLGNITIEKGDINGAKEILLKGLSFLEEDKDPALTGNIELNLGIISELQENFDEARNYYENCLDYFEEVDDQRKFAEAKNNLGLLYIHKKEYEHALFEYDECISLSLEGRYLPTLGIAYLNKAYIYTEIEELKLASYYASKAMDICYQIKDLLSIADIYKIQAIVLKKQFEYQLAEEYFKVSLRLNEEHENERNYAETSLELGLLYNELNSKQNADLYFNKALEYYKKIDAEEKTKKIMEFLK